MPHGMPDWWGAQPDETVFGSRDVAEMAVRLGSIDTYNREGNVIFLDSFEHGLSAWYWSGGGTGNTVYPTVETSMHGGMGIILYPGKVDGGAALIYKQLPYPVLGGIGVEASVMPAEHLEAYKLRIRMFDGTNVAEYASRYKHTTGNIEVCDEWDEWQVVGSPGIMKEKYGSFCNMKMVIDILNGEYVRVLFNNHNYDASAYSPFTEANAEKPSMNVRVTASNTGNYDVYALIDDVIITQNEPVG